MKEQLRALLGVPDDQRIAQFIYNQCRDYEDKIEVQVYNDGKYFERSSTGIDIFYVEDDEFIKLMQQENDKE